VSEEQKQKAINEVLMAAATEFERLQKIIEKWGKQNEWVKDGDVMMPPEGSEARVALDELTEFAATLYENKAAHTLLGFWRTARAAAHLKKCEHCKEEQAQMEAAHLMKGKHWKN
jgi:hypothetical protein